MRLQLEAGERTLLLHSVRAEARIVHHNAFDVKVLLVFAIKHGVGNVRNVVTGIALAGNVNFPVLNAKGVEEVLEETQELIGDVRLARRGRRTLTETRSHWLLDPDHVGQIDPCVGIPDRSECAILPQERAVFLDEALERTATRPAIEPDGDLI